MSRVPRYRQAVLRPLCERFWSAGAELARIESYLPAVLRERIECELAVFAIAIDDATRAVRLLERAPLLKRLAARPRAVRCGADRGGRTTVPRGLEIVA